MTPLYQIADWNKHFENNRSRLVDQCRFACIPNKLGGAGLANVLGEGDGDAIYGNWSLLVHLCSGQPKPRNGYLTADGKKDGRRFSAAELARLFRRPVEEIERCLQVVSSPEVGWMLLLDGAPERHAGVTEPSPERQPGVNEPSPSPALERHAEPSMKERKKEVLSLSESEEPSPERQSNVTEPSLECQSNVNEPSPERQTDVTETSPERQVDVTEAKRFFGKLSEDIFGEPLSETQWPNVMEHYLVAYLPFRREILELIDWFYRLPVNHKIFNITARRQSLAALIQNLAQEVQKIRSARKAIGLNGAIGEIKKINADPDLSAEQIAAAKRIYGDDVPLPPKWSQLSPSVRAEIKNDLEGK